MPKRCARAEDMEASTTKKQRATSISAAHQQETAITARNTESSSFLRLPAELRNSIYELVLCNKTIHVQGAFLSNRRFHHATCTAKWEADYALSKQNGDHKTTQHTEAINIVGCDYFDDRTMGDMPDSSDQDEGGYWNPGHERLDLSILYVSKQTYNEARLLPYSGNIFNFDASMDAKYFILLLTENQKASITAIHFSGLNNLQDMDIALASLPSLAYLRLNDEGRYDPGGSDPSATRKCNLDTILSSMRRCCRGRYCPRVECFLTWYDDMAPHETREERRPYVAAIEDWFRCDAPNQAPDGELAT